MHRNDDELCKLFDKLNLTGRVIRIGQHAVSGGCANVWEAHLVPLMRNGDWGMDSDGEKVAVKVIREVGSSASEACLRKRLIREVRAWYALHHRNVLPLLGFTYGFSPGSRLASLVSPWMPHGTARRYLERRSASERIRVLTGVADGLSFLHRHDVVHGDLKGENIMIDMKLEPRIADFGLSKLLDEVSSTLTRTATGDAFGSVRWTAPELFFSPGATYESDTWSFGMTILELFTNSPPYRHLNNDAQVIIMVDKGELPQRPGPSSGMDDALWDLCCECWRSTPQLRPSTRVIAKRLWELDLNRTLLEHNSKKRRASPSPERSRSSREPESDSEGGNKGRLRKSPKLSALAELAGDSLPSPGSPLSSQRALVRTPTPRTPSSRTASSSHSRTSSMSTRRDSRTELANEIDPRRFLAAAHSEGDLFSTLHHHRSSAILRAQSEPFGLDLILGDQSFGSDSSADMSFALSTPRQDFHHSFGTPPSSYAQLYPPYAMQQQPLIMDGNSDLDLLSQTNFLGGYDADVVHPSQWTSSCPPYIHSAFLSSFPLQNGYASHDGSFTMNSASPYLLPPALPETDDFMSGYSPLENAIPSPHALGEIFSEIFTYGQPPANTSPLFLDEPLYSSPQPLHQNPHQDNYHDQAPWPSSYGTVDFASLQQGIITPALSDISASESYSTPLAEDTPFLGGFGSAFAFESEDEGEELDEGLALFGGLGVSGDFSTSTEVRSPAPPHVDSDQTPHGSPRQLEFAPPLSLRSGNQLRSLGMDEAQVVQQQQQIQMPLTPRMSPTF